MTSSRSPITLMIDPFRCWYIQGLLGPLLASFLGGQDKGDVAILAKQATNVNIIKHSLLQLPSLLSCPSLLHVESSAWLIVPLLIQLIQLLSSLLEALKVSFSQRSSNARSLGSKDAFSDSAVAAVTIVKVQLSSSHSLLFHINKRHRLVRSFQLYKRTSWY